MQTSRTVLLMTLLSVLFLFRKCILLPLLCCVRTHDEIWCMVSCICP